MKAAMEKARATVADFLEAMRDKKGTRFSIKAAMKDGDQVEHLWLAVVGYTDGVFLGKVMNRPQVVKTVRFGEEVSVPREEISDWIFFNDEGMQGGFTENLLLEDDVASRGKGVGKHELIGKWKVLATDSGQGPKALGKFIMEIDESTLTLVAPNGAKQTMGGIRRLASDKTPKEIDLSQNGQTAHGLYELGKEGTLLLLMHNPGEPRPRAFKATSKGLMFMLEKVEGD